MKKPGQFTKSFAMFTQKGDRAVARMIAAALGDPSLAYWTLARGEEEHQ
jgi:hypothetical protein